MNELEVCTSWKKNCVSSIEGEGKNHFIPALPYEVSEEKAMSIVVELVTNHFDRVHVKEKKSDYLHAVFTSKWMRFKDDIQILLDPKNKLIHIRSASRAGYYDFQVNRKRMETFKALFQQGCFRKDCGCSN
ncbi:DUF1499 domain-containing protein [Bacillus sp. 2205SS5-2]|uniref:DUF1499 domain-containing protein n=1 Tax=Bacillus sp. 2205SS5-2 TaxID=3109031 RepID=UPI003006D4E5